MLKSLKSEDIISFFGFGLLMLLIVYSFIDSNKVMDSKTQVPTTPTPSVSQLPASTVSPMPRSLVSPTTISTAGGRFQINSPDDGREREDR